MATRNSIGRSRNGQMMSLIASGMLSIVLLWIGPRSVIRASWHLVTGSLGRD